MYEELITHLRECAVSDEDGCYDCCFIDSNKGNGCKICVAYLAEKAANAIEELQKPKWISVEERLPEKAKGRYWSDEVLVWNGESEFIACYGGLQDMWTASTRITHWMPKPEPPKEETDG